MGASRRMRPFSTSCMTAVATKGLVIEAMWNRDRGVTASLFFEGQDAEALLVDDAAVVDDGDGETRDLLLAEEVLDERLELGLVRVDRGGARGLAAAAGREGEQQDESALHFLFFCTPLEISNTLPE